MKELGVHQDAFREGIPEKKVFPKMGKLIFI